MSRRSSSNRRAIGLMVLAMVGFAVADTLIRLAASGEEGRASAGQIILFQGVFGAAIFGAVLWRNGERVTTETLTDRLVVLRTVSDLIAVTAFTIALTLMPVGTASAMLQIQPLVVTMGAALFLREVVGLRRWAAIGFGFVGVMIIARPGLDAFHSASVLVVIAVLGLSARDLATRALNSAHSTLAVSALVSALMIPLGVALHLALAGETALTAGTVTALVVSSIVAMGAYYAITEAMRIGEISVVAPYRYARVVAAFVVAFLILGERPDVPTLCGSAIVVGAGLWLLWRERTA